MITRTREKAKKKIIILYNQTYNLRKYKKVDVKKNVNCSWKNDLNYGPYPYRNKYRLAVKQLLRC